jgi:hypothetical protein
MEFLHALFVFAFQKLSCEFLHVHMTPIVWFGFQCFHAAGNTTDEFYQVSVCFPDGWWSAANTRYEWYAHNVW